MTMTSRPARPAPGKGGNRRRVATVFGAAFVAAGLVCTAGVMTLNSVRAASDASEANDIRISARTAEFDAMVKDEDGFKTFISSPVFEGPEWAAIVDAQKAKDQADFQPVIDQMRADVKDSTIPPFTSIEMKAVDEAAESWLAPMETKTPLTAASLKAPLKTAFDEGRQACASGDAAAFLESWKGAGSTGFDQVWAANAKPVIAAAADSICG